MQHSQIWRAIDALAARNGLTSSGLARAAGLDPTTFNKSKRSAPDGKPRWPSTESLARALDAVGVALHDFAALVDEREHTGPVIPIVGLARAGADGFFDESGFPIGADETISFPGVGEERIYALEITGDSMAPAFREGDVVIVQPGAGVRRGDRIVVRLANGEVAAKELGRRNNETVELISLNPNYPARDVPAADIVWIARILWASQ